MGLYDRDDNKHYRGSIRKWVSYREDNQCTVCTTNTGQSEEEPAPSPKLKQLGKHFFLFSILMMFSVLSGLGCRTFDMASIVRVHNAKEFLSAIGSNRTIILEPGDYHISGLKQSYSNHIIWEEVFDGDQIVIKDVNNLHIRGASKGTVNILVSPRYANVMTFKNCHQIHLENISFGHTEEPGYCTGGVLSFEDCVSINIINTVLHGSGVKGLFLSRVRDFHFDHSVIRDCTYRIMTVNESQEICFDHSQFFNNKQFEMIVVHHCRNVHYRNCKIHHNIAGSKASYSDEVLLSVSSSSDVRFITCEIKHNAADHFIARKGTVDLDDCDVGFNIIRKSWYKHDSSNTI